MAHGGLTVEQLYREGLATEAAVQHALASGVDADDGPRSIAELVACSLDPDCAAGMADNLVRDDTFTATTRTTETSVDTVTQQVVDDFTTTQRDVFFSIPTAEQFLAEWENAFAGFAANAAAAGLGSGDVAQMLDPLSGFMQKSLQEYLGKIFQQAQDTGESPFRLSGVEGQDGVILGTRPGGTTLVDTKRNTVTKVDQTTAGRTDQSQTTTPTSGERQGEGVSSDSSLTETGQETSAAKVSTEVRSEDVITENIIGRDAIVPILKFSPTDFFVDKFKQEPGLSEEEVKSRFIGALSTEIRTSAPRIRPRGGTPTSVSARRV